MASADLKPNVDPARLAADFERILSRLEASRAFGAGVHLNRLLSQAQKLLRSRDGVAYLYEQATRFDAAGVFNGGDWARPELLQPTLVTGTLHGGGMNAIAECLSELRLLAIAEDRVENEGMDAAAARAFLEQVLASNLDMLFPVATEESRDADKSASERVRQMFELILEKLGAGGILESLIEEVERILLQRPIMVQRVEALLRSARQALEQTNDSDDALAGDAAVDARGWINALHGPTALARDCEIDAYAAALADLSPDALATEARTFGRTMSETGLVAFQHADLLRHLVDAAPELLPEALALDAIGRVSLDTHQVLISDILRFTIWWETARSIYGLSCLLNAGKLFIPPVPPGLRRLMVLNIDEEVAEELRESSEWVDPPNANVLLLAGTLSVVGQPRGVDQGHNPTCQSARAISLWAQNDVGYLLELIAHAARDNEVVTHFEGKSIRSRELHNGVAKELDRELDPVSLLLTPHLDRIYFEMGRYTIGRAGDGHRWINPELHGWWVQRGFAELIDTNTSSIRDCDHFIRLFYAAYHPLYNGGRDLVYAQPCGVASTNYNGEFVGWHAISIERVGRDPEDVWRVYFFNPNRDKGQNWGQGVVTSTHDHGELEGESSLPFEQFASRLYVFHYKPRETGNPDDVSDDTVALVRHAIATSWAARFAWTETE